MAEEANEPKAPPAKSGGGGSLMPALLIIVLMPLVSFAMFKFLFIPMIKAEIPDPAAHAEIDPKNLAITHSTGDAEYSYDFKNVVNNLLGTSHTRFVKVDFTIYSRNPLIAEEVAKKKPKLDNAANAVLGNLTLAQLERPEIWNIVQNQIKEGFDHILPPPMVEEVVISSHQVQ